MSTLAYAALTSKRYQAAPGTSTDAAPPGLRTYVDAMAALVPAELLAAHAVFVELTTTTNSSTSPPTTTITQSGALATGFWGLIVLALVMYVGGRLALGGGGWKGLDFVRLPIPALAFVVWTMLQKTTAFDAVYPGLGAAERDVIAILAAIVLGLAAGWLGYKADQANP